MPSWQPWGRVGAALLVLAALAGVGAGVSLHRPSRPATPAQAKASLARGAAWVWPASNGPKPDAAGAAPYLEAAVLLESLTLRAETVEHGGRNDPLSLPAGARLLPVIHVEAAADAPDAFTAGQTEAIVAAVLRHADEAARGAGVLQLDFEAPARELPAYRALVSQVRHALPPKVRLSVTALAHWCFQGDWLDTLAADEVVPMLFHLGSQPQAWLQRFARDEAAMARCCRGPALGFATNDPPPIALLAHASHPYWFDEGAWSNPSHPPRYLWPRP